MAVGPSTGSSRTLGRYELIQELAKSQLGPLWVAFIPGTETLVSIRRVSTAPPVSAEEKDAISEGGWWTLELSHPAIALGKDVVMSEGELSVVTEYHEGEVLRSLLRLASFKRKPIPLRAALRISLDLLDALNEAELQAQPLSGGKSSYASGGLVPDSVLVSSDGKARLLDVGIAGACSQVSNVARNPEMVSYFSPEQIAGKSADIRSNLYSVGVMLWEMLAGKRLYVGSTYTAVTERIQSGEAARLDASKPVGGDPIPSSVADVVARAMRADPAERYDSPKSLIEALEAAHEPATHEEVAALVDDLAGNTLATRRKVIERAINPAAAAASKLGAGRSSLKSSPEIRSSFKSGPEIKLPPVDSPKPPVVTTKPGLAPPLRQRKSTLMGIAPPDLSVPRAKLDSAGRDKLPSIDSEELESVSKVEAAPLEPSAGELVKALTHESEEPPKVSDADAPGAHLKTKLLGTPAVIPDVKKAAAEEEIEEAPISLDLVPESAAEKGDGKAEPVKAAGKLKPPSKRPSRRPPSKRPPRKRAERDETEGAEEARSSDDSAVAWLGPPPGVALDESPRSQEAKARKGRMVKIVGGALLGATAVLVIALAFGGKKEDAGEGKTAASASEPSTPTEPTKVEEAKTSEPATTAETPKEETAKTEEPAKEEATAKEESTETKTEETPKTTAPTTRWRPRTTSTTKSTATSTSTSKTTSKTTTTKKTKPSYTPSGI